jgi:hypothetical protein
MRRLTPPTFPVFLISLVLAVLALASLRFSIPYVGHYVVAHRFWVMAAAYAVLAAGVIFVGL